MTKRSVALVIGSLRAGSYNRQLASAIAEMAASEFSFRELRINDLPLYNQDDDAHQADTVLRLKKEIQECDALLFVAPEYNRSVPGVLKNAIDHASRPYGQNSWLGKPAGIVCVSVGAAGTAMAQQHLRNILAYLDVPVLGQPEVFIRATDGLFDGKGGIGKSDTQALVQNWIQRYAAWVRKCTATEASGQPSGR
jgi:chromate reductase